MYPIDRPVSSPDALHAWIVHNLGISVPRRGVCPGHCGPFEYLINAYFEPSKDMVVWAPRGGGKTRLAAVATLLDLLHKPGIKVNILGGSLDQSKHVWNHLIDALVDLQKETKGAAGGRVALSNKSIASILAQSQTNVRGQRMQKLRCDEVELFDPDILEAACLTTRSLKLERDRCCNDGEGKEMIVARGAIELISTHHKAGGLMGRVISDARAAGRPVVRWCLMEVLERCEIERECASCALWEDCGGKAKVDCEGFFPIDDAISMKKRVSAETWASEMLCKRPSARGRVFPMFSVTTHVTESLPDGNGCGGDEEMSLAMDFGFAAPFVCLWVRRVGEVVHVVEEYLERQKTLEEHLAVVESRRARVMRVCCDPAGGQRNEQTARSNVEVLRRHGYRVCTRSSRIVDGLEMIRAALRPAWGTPRLFIHPRCVNLIEAMECYHHPDGGGELPEKDGVYDHPVDALRYWFVNRSGGGRVEVARY